MRYVTPILIAMLLLAPAAAAMGGDPLSGENNTLWNQYTTDGGCCTTWASSDKDDPAFTGSGNFGTAGPGVDESFTWEWPLEPALDRTLLLDPDGTIESTVHIGGGVSTSPALGIGDVEISMQLLLGEQVVAEGGGEGILYNQNYIEVSWSVSPQITTLDPAAGNLMWTVTGAGIYSGMYLSHTDANGNGWLTLPIIGVVGDAPEAVTIYQPLETPSLELEFDGPTSDTYIHNLTSDLEQGRLSVTGNGTGNLSVMLKDAENNTLVEETLTDNFTQDFEFDDAVPGDWNLTISLDDYNGTVQAALEALPADGEEPGGAPAHDDGTHGNATTGPAGNETVDDDEGFIPAPGVVPVMVLLVSAVAAARARRARR